MSLLPFARNFFAVQGNKAAVAVTTALVQLDPESASAADLRSMDQDLDRAGGVIVKLRSELTQERHEYDTIKKQYAEFMSAAELMQKRIDASDPSQRAGLEASLAKLLDRIEKMAPDLEREKHDVDATQELLATAEATYQQKVKALTEAKANLDRARHDLQHANMQEQRSRERAQAAAMVAGLTTSPLSGLTVALNTMQASADAARQRAESSDMKATALTAAKSVGDDENIASALAEVKGETASPKSLSERLAALRQQA